MFFNFTFLKLNSIIFFTLCLLFITNFSVNCKVVHTKVDSTLAGRDFMDAKQFWIDFNGDGTDEFFFSHANQGMGEISYVCEIYSGTNQNSNEVLVYNNNRTPVMLSESEVISENMTSWYNSYNGMSTMAMYFENEWVDAGFRFVAMRFKINGNYHYGWVRVSVPSDLSNIIVKDMAWEDTPETSITAIEPVYSITEEYQYSSPFVSFYNNLLIIESTQNLICELYNLTGNKIKSFDINSKPNTFNLVEINPGIYFLILKSNNKCFSRKIIVN